MPLSSMSELPELPVMYHETLENNQVAATHVGALAPDDTSRTG